MSKGVLLYEFFIFPAIRIEWRNVKRIEICFLRYYIGFVFKGKKRRMTEIKKKFDEWIKENGGTGGVLYQTFSDDELEHIFMSAYVKNNKR